MIVRFDGGGGLTPGNGKMSRGRGNWSGVSPQVYGAPVPVGEDLIYINKGMYIPLRACDTCDTADTSGAFFAGEQPC